jgi:hypothetical protein
MAGFENVKYFHLPRLNHSFSVKPDADNDTAVPFYTEKQ